LRHLRTASAESFAVPPETLVADVRRYVAAHPDVPPVPSGAEDTTDHAFFLKVSSTPAGADSGVDSTAAVAASVTGSAAGAVDSSADLSSSALDQVVYELRTAGARFPECRDVQLYHKFNRCHRGELREGQPAPDCVLFDGYTGARTCLHSLVREQPLAAATGRRRPVLVFAGSYS